jgi:galactonate dehydratase
MKITGIDWIVTNISPKSNWSFVRVHTDDGLAGIGEASLQSWETVQAAFVDKVRPDFLGRTLEEAQPLTRVHPHSMGGLVANSVLSALEQALTDLRARIAGVPIHALFGARRLDRVPAYANINRSTLDRTPAGFAQSARSAVAQGYRAIKIAPFDGVFWEDLGDPQVRRNLDRGLERVFATREAVGADVSVLIDCHWRFDETTARDVIVALAPMRPYWLECMTTENPEYQAANLRLHEFARERGIRLAGAERQVAASGFRRYAEAKMLDVVMPDVKYTGGYGEMLRIAADMQRAGVAFSPHNPSGPVCHLASLHVSAVADGFLILEHQLPESETYYTMVKGAHPRLVDGCYEVPQGPGLGVDLDDEVLREHPFRPLKGENVRDPRLG